MKANFRACIHKRDSIDHLMDLDDMTNIIMTNAMTCTNLNVDQVLIKNWIVD